MPHQQRSHHHLQPERESALAFPHLSHAAKPLLFGRDLISSDTENLLLRRYRRNVPPGTWVGSARRARLGARASGDRSFLEPHLATGSRIRPGELALETKLRKNGCRIRSCRDREPRE